MISLFFLITVALSSLDLSIKAAILFGSNKSFFSNSDTCLTSLSTFSGFCFFSSFVLIFLTVLSGSGIDSRFCFSIFLLFCSGETTVLVFVFLIFFGGACSDTSFSFSLTFSIIFFAFGAKGTFVFSAICINSTDTIGGISKGFFDKKGKLIAVITINTM